MIEEVAALLNDVIEAAKKSTWTKGSVENFDAVSYKGLGTEWRIIVVETPGEMYHDGAAAKLGLVLHLPNDTARNVVQIAKEKLNAKPE